jgi:hypothetical protein
LAEPALDSSGISATVDAQLASADAPAIFRVSGRSGVTACMQLDGVADPAGSAWVTPPASGLDYGDYCQSCPQRVSVATGTGLYVLPSSEPLPAPASRLQLRIAARDCTTFLKSGGGSLAPLRLETLAGAAVADTRQGVVYLEVAITAGSALYESSETFPTTLSAAIEQANALFAPGGLSVQAVRVRRIAGEDPIIVERGDHSALDRVGAMLHDCEADGRAPDDSFVPVVLAGCLQVRDPLLMQRTEVDGLVPHIPDGFPAEGRAHGVFLKGRGCSSGSPSVPIEPQVLGKLLAHELGHYLGLYHSVEADGATDAIADTSAANIMNYRPLQVSAPEFTAGQFRVMRRHPAIHWQ